MQLFIRTADYAPNPNITEAAFDHFSLSNEPILDLSNEGSSENFVLYPNPGNDKLQIEGLRGPSIVQLFQLDGKCCLSSTLLPNQAIIDTKALPNGAYIVEIEGQRFSWVKLGQ
jgi:hypothetical protein